MRFLPGMNKNSPGFRYPAISIRNKTFVENLSADGVIQALLVSSKTLLLRLLNSS